MHHSFTLISVLELNRLLFFSPQAEADDKK